MNVARVSDLPRLPPRDPLGHKGSFGTVVVLGGCDGGGGRRTMLGAPALVATAALRSGAGLATIVAPATLLPHVLAVCPAATGFGLPLAPSGEVDADAAEAQVGRAIERAAAVVVGPGLSEGAPQRQLVVRLAGGEGPPLVVDADALNALASLEEPAIRVRATSVLTPHPGEFARLASALRLPLDADAATAETKRAEAAAALARRLRAVVALKGAGTIVSDGERAWRCERGNAALAVGGSGDVLSGIIGGLVAQFVRPPHRMPLFDCARLGVLIHALAAERWAARHATAGMLPTDLCAEIPDVLRDLRTG